VQRLLLISIFLLNFQSVFASFKCLKNGKIRHVKGKEQIVKDAYYCINHNNYDIMSFSCLKSSQCKAIQSYKHTKNLMIHGEIGSPYHRKCYLLGGTPSLVEYFDGKAWHQTGICKFDDSSFISVFNTL